MTTSTKTSHKSETLPRGFRRRVQKVQRPHASLPCHEVGRCQLAQSVVLGFLFRKSLPNVTHSDSDLLTGTGGSMQGHANIRTCSKNVSSGRISVRYSESKLSDQLISLWLAALGSAERRCLAAAIPAANLGNLPQAKPASSETGSAGG